MRLDKWSLAIIASVGAQIIWGAAAPLVKIILGTVPPMSLLFLRSLFASLLLYFAVTHLLPKKEMAVAGKDRLDIFLAGFTGVFLNITLYFFAQRATTVIDAWVIGATNTIFTVAIAYLFFSERLSRIVYLGIGIAFIGALVVIGSPLLSAGSGSVLGNALMLGAVLSAVVSSFYAKKLIGRYSPLLLTYYFFLTSAFLSFPFFLWEFWQNPAWLASMPAASYLIIAYLVLGSSIGAYFLFNFSLKVLSPSLTSVIGYVSILVAVPLSIIFLGERPTISFGIGALVILIGLFLAETRHPGHPIHKLRVKN